MSYFCLKRIISLEFCVGKKLCDNNNPKYLLNTLPFVTVTEFGVRIFLKLNPYIIPPYKASDCDEIIYHTRYRNREGNFRALKQFV